MQHVQSDTQADSALSEFERMVKGAGSERAAKGLSSWSQFVAMMFCQLGRAPSPRELEGGLKSCEGKLAHLGIEAPARSSLFYANGHRPWELYEKVFYALFERVAAQFVGKKKFRFKSKLASLNSTVIDLCLSMFDWRGSAATQGGGQAASGARPRRLSAHLRDHHRGSRP